MSECNGVIVLVHLCILHPYLSGRMEESCVSYIFSMCVGWQIVDVVISLMLLYVLQTDLCNIQFVGRITAKKKEKKNKHFSLCNVIDVKEKRFQLIKLSFAWKQIIKFQVQWSRAIDSIYINIIYRFRFFCVHTLERMCVRVDTQYINKLIIIH